MFLSEVRFIRLPLFLWDGREKVTEIEFEQTVRQREDFDIPYADCIIGHVMSSSGGSYESKLGHYSSTENANACGAGSRERPRRPQVFEAWDRRGCSPRLRRRRGHSLTCPLPSPARCQPANRHRQDCGIDERVYGSYLAG